MLGRKIDIHYFSGTGNTLLLVRAVAAEFNRRNFEVRLFRIEKETPQEVNVQNTLGLAFPVAAQGTYPFIWEFIRDLPQTEDTPVILMDTMFMYSGGILGPVKKIIRAKGYIPMGACEFRMPCNVFCRQGMTEKKKKKIKRTQKQVATFIEQLIAGKGTWWDIPLYSDLMAKLSSSHRMWNLYRRLTPVQVDKSKCKGCGLCAQLCPVGNVGDSRPPNFVDKCVLCMRCYSFCPTEAIYFRNYKGARYQAVTASEIINPNFEG